MFNKILGRKDGAVSGSSPIAASSTKAVAEEPESGPIVGTPQSSTWSGSPGKSHEAGQEKNARANVPRLNLSGATNNAERKAAVSSGQESKPKGETSNAAKTVDKRAPWTKEERQAHIRKRLGEISAAQLHFLEEALRDAELPDPWVTTRSKDGRLFFFNQDSKKSDWSHPVCTDDVLKDLLGICQQSLQVSSAQERHAFLAEKYNGYKKTAEEQLSKWLPADDGQGNQYYYHSDTMETTWDNPSEGLLVEWNARLEPIRKLTDEKFVANLLQQDREGTPPQKITQPSTSQAQNDKSASMAERTVAAVRQGDPIQATENVKAGSSKQATHEVAQSGSPTNKLRKQGSQTVLEVVTTKSKDSAVGHLVETTSEFPSAADLSRLQELQQKLIRQEEAAAEAAANYARENSQLLQQVKNSEEEARRQEKQFLSEQKRLQGEVKDAQRAVEKSKLEEEQLQNSLRDAMAAATAKAGNIDSDSEKEDISNYARENLQLLQQVENFEEEARKQEKQFLSEQKRLQGEVEDAQLAVEKSKLEEEQLQNSLRDAMAAVKAKAEKSEVTNTQVLRKSEEDMENMKRAHAEECRRLRIELEQLSREAQESKFEVSAAMLTSKALVSERDAEAEIAMANKRTLEERLKSLTAANRLLEDEKKAGGMRSNHDSDSTPPGSPPNAKSLDFRMLEEVQQEQMRSMLLQKEMQEEMREMSVACQKVAQVAVGTANEAMEQVTQVMRTPEEIAAERGAEREREEVVAERAAEIAAKVALEKMASQENERAAEIAAKVALEKISSQERIITAAERTEVQEDVLQQRLAAELKEAMESQKRSVEEMHELLARFDALKHDDNPHEQLAQEFQQSLQKAQHCTELAVKQQVEEAFEKKFAQQQKSAVELKSTLEMKQDKVDKLLEEKHNTLAAAFQKQVADAFSPLEQHVKDVSRQQNAKATTTEARINAEDERRLLHAFEKQTYEVQSQTEAMVKQQMNAFMAEVRGIELSRKEDAERLSFREIERRQSLEHEREQQHRADAKIKFQLQEAEDRQKKSREDMMRLEEELWKTRHAELSRREEELIKDMKWNSEKRDLELRAQHRELDLTAEVKHMKVQLDMRAAQNEIQHYREHPRSSSRVRDALYDAVDASHNYDERLNYSGGPEYSRKLQLGKKSRPTSASSMRSLRPVDHWEEAEDAVERLVEKAIPRNVARGFGMWDDDSKVWIPKKSGSGSRPSSASSNRRIDGLRIDPPETHLKQATRMVEQRGNLQVNHATGHVTILKPLRFEPRTTKDRPTAVFLDIDVAEAICKDLAELSNMFNCPMTIEGHTRGGESNFWQTLADNRANIISQLIVEFGANPSLLRAVGKPGRLGKNDVRTEVFMDIRNIHDEVDTISTGRGIEKDLSQASLGPRTRPSSAPANRSNLVDDLAADLQVDKLGPSRERGRDYSMKKGKPSRRSPLSKSHSQPNRAVSYGQIAKMVNQNQSRPRDSAEIPMTLKKVFHSYPEVAQILSVGVD